MWEIAYAGETGTRPGIAGQYCRTGLLSVILSGKRSGRYRAIVLGRAVAPNRIEPQGSCGNLWIEAQSERPGLTSRSGTSLSPDEQRMEEREQNGSDEYERPICQVVFLGIEAECGSDSQLPPHRALATALLDALEL